MDKILDQKVSAEKYWEKQLKDVNKQFISIFNITIVNYKDHDNVIHLYPDNVCQLCNLISNAIKEYCSTTDYNKQLKTIAKLKNYRINGKIIDGCLLLKLKQIDDAINNFINHNMDCETCKIINALCEEYYTINDIDRKEQIINILSLHEMNGYKLLKYKEMHGHDLNQIDLINHYIFEIHDVDNVDLISNIDSAINRSISLDRSHWCKSCGARKPDIIIERSNC